MLIKISQREKDILSTIEHRGNEPIAAIRQRTGYRDHTIRYYMEALKEKGILLGRSPFISIYALGYHYYTLFFSVHVERVEDKEAMLNALMESHSVSFLRKLGGEYHYAVSVCARDIGEVSEFFSKFSVKYGKFFFEKSLIVPTRFTIYPKRYLAPKLNSHPVFSIGCSDDHTEIDEIDNAILSGMAEHPECSQRDLAKILEMPISSVGRRIRKLEERGVIGGITYKMDLKNLGIQEYKLLINSRGMNLELTKNLHSFVKSELRALRLVECMGAWDYEIDVEVEVAEDVTEIVDNIYQKYGKEINSIKLLQVFQTLKYSPYPFEQV